MAKSTATTEKDFGYDHRLKLKLKGLQDSLKAKGFVIANDAGVLDCLVPLEKYWADWREKRDLNSKDYLEDGFDLKRFTIPCLRQILSQYGIAYDSPNPLKQHLLDLLQEHLDDIRAANGIEVGLAPEEDDPEAIEAAEALQKMDFHFDDPKVERKHAADEYEEGHEGDLEDELDYFSDSDDQQYAPERMGSSSRNPFGYKAPHDSRHTSTNAFQQSGYSDGPTQTSKRFVTLSEDEYKNLLAMRQMQREVSSPPRRELSPSTPSPPAAPRKAKDQAQAAGALGSQSRSPAPASVEKVRKMPSSDARLYEMHNKREVVGRVGTQKVQDRAEALPQQTSSPSKQRTLRTRSQTQLSRGGLQGRRVFMPDTSSEPTRNRERTSNRTSVEKSVRFKDPSPAEPSRSGRRSSVGHSSKDQNQTEALHNLPQGSRQPEGDRTHALAKAIHYLHEGDVDTAAAIAEQFAEELRRKVR